MERMVPETIKRGDCLKRIMYMGKAMALITEANETILATIKIANQVKITKLKINFMPVISMLNPANTPKVVATPLPPLNFKNIVQLWPQIQLRPMMIRNISCGINVILADKMLPKNTTVRRPLSISKINTAMPGPLPKTLSALVAPTFLEPKLRISMPFNNLPNI